MYGKNPVRKREHLNNLQVAEIFWTIQGEGPYSGHPAVFIRLTGCNLQCDFCDTTWDDDKDPWMPPQAIAERAREVSGGRATLFVITGGEPTRQDLDGLIGALTLGGGTVQIETNGAFWQNCFAHPQVVLVVSPKTPSINKQVAAWTRYWKYPLQAHDLEIDGLPKNTARPELGHPGIFVTPCEDIDPEKTKDNTRAVSASAMRHGYLAQVQIHKILKLR